MVLVKPAEEEGKRVQRKTDSKRKCNVGFEKLAKSI